MTYKYCDHYLAVTILKFNSSLIHAICLWVKKTWSFYIILEYFILNHSYWLTRPVTPCLRETARVIFRRIGCPQHSLCTRAADKTRALRNAKICLALLIAPRTITVRVNWLRSIFSGKKTHRDAHCIVHIMPYFIALDSPDARPEIFRNIEDVKNGETIQKRFRENKRAMALYTCVDKGNKSVTGFWQRLRPLQPPTSLRCQIWPQI